MASALTKREISEEILFGPRRAVGTVLSAEAHGGFLHRSTADGVVKLPDFDLGAFERSPRPNELGMPRLVPTAMPQRSTRQAPWLVRINRLLQTSLISFCGMALLGYGFDVAVSNDVVRLQEQARRLSEQNSELSAQLLKSISFQGIQESALGRAGLRVPEQVIIAKEVQPVKIACFKSTKHYLPLMSGY